MKRDTAAPHSVVCSRKRTASPEGDELDKRSYKPASNVARRFCGRRHDSAGKESMVSSIVRRLCSSNKLEETARSNDNVLMSKQEMEQTLENLAWREVQQDYHAQRS